MKKSELKEIIKECIEEIFEENNFFMNLVSESLRVAISTTLKESLNAIPQRENGSQPRTSVQKYINPNGKFDPRAFLTSQHAQENLNNALTDIVKEEKSSSTEYQREIEIINKKISDEDVFGDMNQFFNKAKKLYKGGKS